MDGWIYSTMVPVSYLVS